ncbi:MAG: hypothetical protein B7Y37_13645 [Sphingobacteriia bacterium 28-36-52]|nr:MAG: hypothetical protein B7Y37_13645 [Sphingobacteriia bacterium 28-36-52]
MNKHTPAPWLLEKTGYINHLSVYVNDKWLFSFHQNGFFKEENEANAKLIAAAPELLEAAIKLQEWNKKYPPNKIYDYGRGKAIEAELTEIVNMQIEAIKKSTE